MSDTTRGFDGIGGQRHVSHTIADDPRDRVCERGARWSLRRLAGAEERLPRARHHLDLDRERNVGEARDRIFAPVERGAAVRVEADRFVPRPAQRLDDPAFDLVADPARIDRFAAVDRCHRAVDDRPAGVALDLDVERHCTIGAKIFL